MSDPPVPRHDGDPGRRSGVVPRRSRKNAKYARNVRTSGPRGATVSVDIVSAENGWAVDVGLEAGLSIGSCGPMFVRGRLGALAPFLPNGAYL